MSRKFKVSPYISARTLANALTSGRQAPGLHPYLKFVAEQEEAVSLHVRKYGLPLTLTRQVARAIESTGPSIDPVPSMPGRG